ncbi:MAG: hypothetical protein QNJ38_19580 [Prochloraceae cyanobacterium]|nr:hypothetical protein [Prochloraceae cyanobacterium]
MNQKINEKNQIIFRSCQSNECLELQEIIEEEVGEFDLDAVPIAFLRLFEVETSLSNNPNQLLLGLLENLDDSIRSLLNPNYQEIRFPNLKPLQAKGLLFDLLMNGTAGGCNAIDDKNAVIELIEKLFNWCGEGCYFYTNYNRKYIKRNPEREGYSYPYGGGSGWELFKTNDYSGDEGLIFVSPSKAGIFWFFGDD